MKARISRYPFFRVVIVLLALSAAPSQLPYAQNDILATTPETQFQDDSAGVLSDSLVVPDTQSILSQTLTVVSPAADSETQAAPSPEATSTDTSSIVHNDHDTTLSSVATPNDNVIVQPKYDQSTPAQPPPGALHPSGYRRGDARRFRSHPGDSCIGCCRACRRHGTAFGKIRFGTGNTHHRGGVPEYQQAHQNPHRRRCIGRDHRHHGIYSCKAIQRKCRVRGFRHPRSTGPSRLLVIG